HAAIARVVAVDAGDREAVRAAERGQCDLVADALFVLQREALRYDDTVSRHGVSQRLGGARGDHRQVAEAGHYAEVAAGDGDGGVAVGGAASAGAVEGGDEGDLGQLGGDRVREDGGVGV